MKKTTFFLFLILAISAFSADAADIYLDKNATGCSNGSTNYNPATRSCGSGTGYNQMVYLSPYQCSKVLGNGSHVYIRQGEYYEDVTGTAEYALGNFWGGGRVHVGTFFTAQLSNGIVENYNGELVWLMGMPQHDTATMDSSYTNYPLTVDGNNNLFKGNGGNFKIWGMVPVMGSNNVIDGLDLSGGGVRPPSGQCWPATLYFLASNNATVKNSRIHDNKWCGTAVGTGGNGHMVMHESDAQTIIENNEFYNPYDSLVYHKYDVGYHSSPACSSGFDPQHLKATYRYNIIRANGKAWYGTAGHCGPNGQDVKVYQNIFYNIAGFHDENMVKTYAMQIYNNTFYNATFGGRAGAMSDWLEFYNNIFYTNSGSTTAYYDGPSAFSGYSNYNDYYSPSGIGSFNWTAGGANGRSFSYWQGLRFDVNAVTSNPNFLNASGTFSLATDFKRSSYPANGRGGSFPSVMGAYITGNEVIGVSSGAQSPSPKTPNSPVNLMVN